MEKPPRYRHEVLPFTRRRTPVVTREAVLGNGGNSVGPGYNDDLCCVRRRDGRFLWQFGERWSGHDLLTRPVCARGLVIVANSGGVLFALDEGTGAVRWQTEFRRAPERGRDEFLSGDPIVVGEEVVMGDSLGRVRVFSRASGELRREAGLAASMLAVEQDRGVLWVSGQEGFVAAVDLATCAPVWRRALDRTLAGPVVVADGLVLARAVGGELIALARGDGSVVWRAGEVAGAARSAGGALFVTTTHGELGRIDPATGRLEICLPGQLPELLGEPVVADEDVYVETARGFLRISGEDVRVCLVDAAGGEPAAFVVADAELVVYKAKRRKGYLSRAVDGQQSWCVRIGDYDLT